MQSTILILGAALAAATLAATPAAASEESAAMAAVTQYDAYFNTGDAAKAKGMCAPRAIIIDDFAPHVWQGPGACANWWQALGAYDTKSGIADGVVAIAKPWRVTVTGNRAYVVVPATYTYTQHGKPVVEAGSVWTLALVKLAGAWRISGWAWAQHQNER